VEGPISIKVVFDGISASKEAPVSSIGRVLGLIDLFTEARPVWTADELIQEQGRSRATTYRDLKALVDAGLLVPVGAGSYALGPRFIEIDRQIRLADPLLSVAPPIMAAQRKKFGGTQLLFRFYGLQVLSIYEDRNDDRIRTSLDRGRPVSLFQGSPSRVILAHLPREQQQRLFLQHAGEIAETGLGENWPAFQATLSQIRERGIAVASDIDKNLIGFASPVFMGPDAISAAFVLARIKREVDEAEYDRLSKLSKSIARSISDRLQALTPAEVT
jgi:DNA-binding IclR family transcriptional regulator